MTGPAFNQVLFDEVINSLPQDNLTSLRQDAAARFAASGFPTTRHEDWHYTSLAPAIALSNTWLADSRAAPRPTGEAVNKIQSSIEAYWIPIRNGLIDVESVGLPDCVTVTRLTEEVASSNIAIDDPMTQFNAALLHDGLRISVSASATVDKPIGFLIDDIADDKSEVSQTRIIVELLDGASASIIEAHVSSGDGEHFANNVVQLDLLKNAKVDYLRIQQRARHHIHTGKLTVELAEYAEFNHCAVDLGGALIRSEITARLHGRDATTSLNGLYLAGDQQHIDNHTRVDHLVGPGRSHEEYRGILNRKSRCVFNGKAIVHPGADGTDANQSNHNLLLSDDAEIDTKPELEIYADEVKCSHGATVGQLDEAALFYLRTRGLDKAESTRLITRAFASKILSVQPVGAANEYLARSIDERLNKLIGDN